MCGISVILDRTKKLDGGPIQQMNNALSHRGPDANGWVKLGYQNQQVFLGHTRLSIIDASNQSANQPFVSNNERYWLVFNGEIYNYLELKGELEILGKRFKTNSDTEVLVEGLALFGVEFLDRVNGMYAFVCWDTENQEVIAARDPSGMKSLYVFENENYKIFSSSIFAIEKSTLTPLNLEVSSIEPYLHFKFSPSPKTFYATILTVPVYQSKSKTYRFGGNRIASLYNEESVISKVEELLKSSVRRHLISDKSVGLFLSGGVDSTLILSILRGLSHDKFPVFTIGSFIENPSSPDFFQVTEDSTYAHFAAKQFGGELVELQLGDEILLEFDQMVQAMDQPIADPAALLTYIISREAKKNVSVVLSGAGADEVFAGYNRHFAFDSYLKYWSHLPSWVHLGLAILSNQINKVTSNSRPRLKHKLTHTEKFFREISTDRSVTFQNFTSLGFFEPGKVIGNEKVLKSREHYLNQALAMDRMDFLSQDILAMTDQMSMAHSLEVRLPYLDKELTQLVDSLPSTFLLKHGRKWILNEILLKSNGRRYVKRKKEGFGMPLGYWLRKPKNSFLYERLLDPRNLIFEWVDFARTKEIIRGHLSQRMDFSKEIWALAVFEKWFQNNHFSK